MQKYDEKLKICLKKYLTNLVCNLEDARDDVQKRVYNGNLTKSECEKKTYTGLEERGTLIRCGTVFFVNPQEFGVRLLWFLGTVEIGISLRFDKKYFGRSHFRFVIFSLV